MKKSLSIFRNEYKVGFLLSRKITSVGALKGDTFGITPVYTLLSHRDTKLRQS